MAFIMTAKKKKSDKPIKLNEIEPEEQLKYEIAEELGLLDQVLKSGWKSLLKGDRKNRRSHDQT